MNTAKTSLIRQPGRIRLGSRRSPLAVAQAKEARTRLASANNISPEMIEIVTVIASGDRIQDRPLAELGGKALWTKELDIALMTGEIDCAVHSAKDVETFRPKEIALAAILPREDVRDVLIGASSIAALAKGAVVGTSAPRRAAQLLNLRPDCRVVSFRGNVATRLAKLERGEADATFLAYAGLKRLGEGGTGSPLNAEEWLPAPSQAAIAIEARANDAAMLSLLDAVNDKPSRAMVMAERDLLAALGGSCHSPVAMLSRIEGKEINLRAVLLSPDGTSRVEGDIRFTAGDSDGPARLAADLLARAPHNVAIHFSGKPPA